MPLDLADAKAVSQDGTILLAVSRSDPSHSYLLLSAVVDNGGDSAITDAMSALVRSADPQAWLDCWEVEVGDSTYNAFPVTEEIDRLLSLLVDIVARLRLEHSARVARSLQLEFAL